MLCHPSSVLIGDELLEGSGHLGRHAGVGGAVAELGTVGGGLILSNVLVQEVYLLVGQRSAALPRKTVVTRANSRFSNLTTSQKI